MEIRLNDIPICRFTLIRHGWLELEIALPDAVSNDGTFHLEIRTNRTWQPRPHDAENRGDREISIAVCNIRCS